MVREQIDQCVKDNQGITTDEIASEVSISCGKKLYENILKSNQKMLFCWKWRNVCTIRPNALTSRAVTYKNKILDT
jgi:hypothetical protein